MTAKDSSPRSSDNTPGSILVNDTMSTLAELLQGIQLSEERAAKIIGAVCAITTDASPTQHDICALPLPQLPTAASSDTAVPGFGEVPLVQEQTEVVPLTTSVSSPADVTHVTSIGEVPPQLEVGPQVPLGHYIATYNGTAFVLPVKGEPEPFYLVTKGKMVGVFSNWENVRPLVDGVSGATFRRLPSGTVISQGHQMFVNAIRNKVVKDVSKTPAVL